MESLRRLRETKAASGVKGARGRCGGCQRGFVRLRRVKEAGGGEMGFCACVRRRSEARFLSRSRKAPPPLLPEPSARVRESSPYPGEGTAFPTVKLRRLFTSCRGDRTSALAPPRRRRGGHFRETDNLAIPPPGGLLSSEVPGCPGRPPPSEVMESLLPPRLWSQ